MKGKKKSKCELICFVKAYGRLIKQWWIYKQCQGDLHLTNWCFSACHVIFMT